MTFAATLPLLPPETLPDGKVRDFIDGKIRNDTPEEYVRQNIERRLVLELGYEASQIAIEFPIRMGSKRKRADIVIFPREASHSAENALVIIECKRDSVQPTSKRDGVEQLKSYMAACPNAEWGMWTNGKQKAVYRRVVVKGRIAYEEPNDIPSYGKDADSVDRPQRDELINATDDNLLFTFKICHNHIYVTDGMQKQPAFFELLKVIFCKIYDERNVPNPLNFYATTKEKKTNDGQLSVKNRISRIFNRVKKRYGNIFAEEDVIKLQPRSLAHIVGELQRYSLLDTHVDVKGKAYEELVGANLRGDRGEFFTPRNVQRMAIRMVDLNIEKEERILDPACGTGGFLVIAMNQMLDELRGEQGSGWQQMIARERASEIAAKCFFGFDINPDLVKSTKMNMVMNNDGSGNILRQDSLRHPHSWDWEFKKNLAQALDIDPMSLRSGADLSHFDVVATNPPFGSKLPVKDVETLEQYQLARVWAANEEGWFTPTDALQTSVPPEILFIERCWQFLKPGGRMAIVLPDAILGAPGLTYVRHWILTTCRLIASIDLHPDTFQPRNGTQTSVLILQRKTDEERIQEATARRLNGYNIFMAQVKAIGHDKRGNSVYVRNEDGEEVLFEMPVTSADGVATAWQKRLDDETPLVADEFLSWKSLESLGW